MTRRLLILVTLALAVPLRASTLDTIRAQFLAYESGAGADPATPRMQAALAALTSSAETYSAPGYLLSNGSWSDINYSDVPSGSWSPWNHTRRLMVMAKAYRTPGQPLYGDPFLRAQIESALSYVPAYYGVLTPPPGNWWFWSIGVPLDLAPTLVLMRGDISDTIDNECVTTLMTHIGLSATARALVGPIPTGENLVWSAYTHLCLALLRDDPTMLPSVVSAMSTACAITTGDGIQADDSFHQHGPQLYTGGYGGSFADDVAQYELLTRGTDAALPPQPAATFAGYLADGIAWSLYENFFDVSVIGRQVSYPSTTGYEGIAALLQASHVPSPRQADIEAAAAQMLQTWNGTLPVELAALADIGATGSWPSGHRHYLDSDYTIHRRPGWFASIKMFSSRTISGESTNNENLLGSRQSDGRFYLVLDGNQFFTGDVWPAFDWTRLPGITVEQKAGAASNVYGYGTRSFAGGTGDGENGVSAMDYAPLDSSVTAKKSWFFFDGTIVFLTNSINSNSGNPVETIIDQRPSTTPMTLGSGWAFADGIGYWFYGVVPQIQHITRTGTWAALNVSGDTTPHTATFNTLWIDHGTSPAGATAAYAIVPSTTAAAMARYVPPRILANDASVSAVQSGGDMGIVFWNAGSFAGVTTSAPAIVWLTPSDVYVTDPTNGQGDFTLTVGNARFTVPRNGGTTFHAHLTPRRRSVLP